MRANPDPNVMVVQRLEMMPVEIVVRDYLAGSTATSILPMYQAGARTIYGVEFPDGLRANEKLPWTIITPTTKAAHGAHDAPLSSQDIIDRQILTPRQWDDVAQKAFALFWRGREIAAARGLILADTKYEFGFNAEGDVVLADEIHTPDSSRYWLAETYDDRLRTGLRRTASTRISSATGCARAATRIAKKFRRNAGRCRCLRPRPPISARSRLIAGRDFVLPDEPRAVAARAHTRQSGLLLGAIERSARLHRFAAASSASAIAASCSGLEGPRERRSFKRGAQVLHGAQDLRRGAAAMPRVDVGHAAEDGLDGRLVSAQQLLAIGRDRVELARAVASLAPGWRPSPRAASGSDRSRRGLAHRPRRDALRSP